MYIFAKIARLMIMLIQSFQTYPVTGGFWTDGPDLQ